MTAKSTTTVDLAWDADAVKGKLYRSTQDNFAAVDGEFLGEFDSDSYTFADGDRTPETTYHYLFVPDSADYSEGRVTVETVPLTSVALIATAKSPTSIDLKWTGSGGKLYRSLEAEFTPSEATHITGRDADESDNTKLSYTDSGLTPGTMYYYILMPSSADYAQGKAEIKTPDVERSAQASFTLLKADGDAAGATIGGAVTVVFELELENAKAGSKNAVVRIQETGEENDVSHEPEEDHIDLPALDFTKKDGWQQWLDDDGDGPQPASWKTATSAPVGTGKWRWSYAWNTAGAPIPSGDSKLLNHNGEHTISLAKVDGDEGSNTLDFGDESADVEEKKATVGNLVITGISTNINQDYFAFDRGSSNQAIRQPTIRFNIEDASDVHQYKWKIVIRPTWWPWSAESRLPDTPYAYLSGTAASPGEISVTWSGGRSNNNLDEWDQPDPDTYAFDIYVDEVDSAVSPTVTFDSAQMRTPYNLSVATHDSQLNNNISPARVEVSYRLADKGDLNATSFRTDIVDNVNLSLLSSVSLPTQVNFDHTSIPVYSMADVTNEVRTIFCGEDAHKAEYRDHKNRRTVAMNQTANRKIILFFDKQSVGAIGGVGAINTREIVNAFVPAGFTIGHTDFYTLVWAGDANNPGGLPNAAYDYARSYGYTRGVLIYQRDTQEASGIPAHSYEVWRTCGLPSAAGDRTSRRLPGKLSFSREGIINNYGDTTATAAELKIPIANAIIHEMGHVLGSTTGFPSGVIYTTNHCDLSTCVMYPYWHNSKNFSMGTTVWGTPNSDHAKDHLNRMRRNMGLGQLP